MLGTQAKRVRKLLTFLASCGGIFTFARRGVCRSAVAVACALTAAALGACGGSSGSGATVDLPSTGSTAALTAQTTPAVGVADAVSGSRSAAPLSLIWPKGAPAVGDLLVACVESQYAATPQSPAGWTALYSTSLNSFGTALFYKTASANESASVVFRIPSPYNVSAAMIRVSGAATGAPLWSHAAAKTASFTTAPIVPNVLGMLPLACFGGVNATSFSVAAGWKVDAGRTGAYLTTIEQRQATTTDLTTRISVSTTATGSQSNNNAYGLLVAPARASSGGVNLSPATVAFTGDRRTGSNGRRNASR